MAKVLGPLHSDRVKGSVSGITFREYRGMGTTTRRSKPVYRVTTRLSNNRSIFAYLSRRWGQLDSYTRNLWYLYAVAHPRSNGMGGTFQLDGNQMYMSINHTVIRILGYVNVRLVPPEGIDPAVVDTLAAVTGIASGGITATWTCLGVPMNSAKTEIQVAGPFTSAGRVAVGSRFRNFTQVAGDVLTFEITGLQPDVWYWVRCRYISAQGEISNWVADQACSKL